MRRCICFLLATALILGINTCVLAQDNNIDGVSAAAYVVMDAQSGQVLMQKNAQQTNYPASITKIMTMALAFEKSGGDFDQKITVSKSATQIPRGSSHVALLEGEEITLRDALHATLLHSANDGANVLAEYTAGSIEAFVALMNEKAAQIGCTGTNFSNAHGYHEEQHYVTAQDMAIITRWAYSIPGFEEFFSQWQYKMPANNKQPERLFGTDNLMLVTSKYEYEGTLGGKSGYTNEARYTMVEVVQREGRRFISVVLGCNEKYAKFSDSIALMDYAFENFRTVTLDGTAFSSKTTPVYGGGDKPIGEVKVNVPAVTLMLPAGVSQSDLQVEYNVPDKYVIGRQFNATCTIMLKTQGSDLSTQLTTVNMETGSLGEILARNTGVSAMSSMEITGSSKGINLWVIILGGIVLCAIALIAGRIAYVAFIKAQRRRRKMERLREMYLHNNVGPSMTATQARALTVQRKNAYVQKPPKYSKNNTVNTTSLHVVLGSTQPARRASR